VQNLVNRLKTLSGARWWVLAAGVLTLACAVTGLVAIGTAIRNLAAWCAVGDVDEWGVQTFEGCPGDGSGLWWGSALVVMGLLLAGFTCLAGAVVWSVEASRPVSTRIGGRGGQGDGASPSSELARLITQTWSREAEREVDAHR